MQQTYREFSDVGVSATPGLCYLCRTPRQPRDEAIVSTGVFIDNEGALEICQPCILEMAAHFGVVTSDRADGLRRQNRTLGRQIKATLSAQDSQRAVIQSLNDQIEVLRDSLAETK